MHFAYGMFQLTKGQHSFASLMALIYNAGSDAFHVPPFLTKELEILWLKEDITEAEMPPEELEYDTVYTIRTRKERLAAKASRNTTPGRPCHRMEETQMHCSAFLALSLVRSEPFP